MIGCGIVPSQGGISSIFLPAVNRQLYLRADRQVYNDGGSTLATDGQTVQEWHHQGSESNDVTQSTAAKKPTFETGEINGKPVVRLDGVDDLLVGTSFLSGSAGEVYVVVRMISSLQEHQYVISSGDEGSPTGYLGFVSYFTTANPNIRSAQNSGGTEDSVRGSTTIVAGTVYLIGWRSSGTAYTFRVNGSDESLTVTAGSNSGDWWDDTANRDSMAVGSLKRSTEGLFLKGDVADVIIYSIELSVSQRLQIERFLNGKYQVY